MFKTLIITFFCIIHSSAYSKNECLEKIEACTEAKRLAQNISKSLPIKSGLINTKKVEAINNVIDFYLYLDHTKDQTQSLISKENTTIHSLKDIISEILTKDACKYEEFENFINSGGEFKYNIFYSDKETFNSITIKQCHIEVL